MAEKVTKSMKVSASGLLSIEDNDIFVEVADVGTFSLKKLLKVFDGCSVKLSCSYDEEQASPKPDVDEETGEILDL
jgi:hypothetical protein